MSGEPIDLFGGLRIDKRNPRTGGARVTVEFTAPGLAFHADEKAIAGEVAQAIAETIRDNLLAGLAPDGSALPAPEQATLERRDYRLAQASRGGQLTERITDKRDRSKGLRRWYGRFRPARMGYHAPQTGAHGFGVESGILARSVAAVPEGGAWRVFFAAIRARLDRSGQNAVLRVFKRIPIWNDAASRQPRMQAALRSVQAKLLASSAARALAEARAAVANLVSLSEDLEDDGG